MKCLYYNNNDTCSDDIEIYDFEGTKLWICWKHVHKFWKIKWELEEAKIKAYKKLLEQK